MRKKILFRTQGWPWLQDNYQLLRNPFCSFLDLAGSRPPARGRGPEKKLKLFSKIFEKMMKNLFQYIPTSSWGNSISRITNITSTCSHDHYFFIQRSFYISHFLNTGMLCFALGHLQRWTMGLENGVYTPWKSPTPHMCLI